MADKHGDKVDNEDAEWLRWQASMSMAGDDKFANRLLQIAERLSARSAGGLTAKQQFDAMLVEDTTPLERLRFFCSFAMNGQDWLDVEPFFAALETLQSATGARLVQVGWGQIERRVSGAHTVGSISDERTASHRDPIYVMDTYSTTMAPADSRANKEKS